VTLYILDMFTSWFRRSDVHLQEVIRGASVAFTLKGAAAVIAFALNLILARMLGPDGAGLYFLALTVVTIVAMLSKVGLDNTIVRFTALNAIKGDWGAVKGLYRKGMLLTLAVSLLFTSLLFVLAPWLANTVFHDPRLAAPLRWMSLAVAPFALVYLQGQALTGLKKIREGVALSGAVLSGLTLLGVLILVPLYAVTGAVAAYALASFVTLGIGLLLWKRATPDLKGTQGSFPTDRMLASSMPLFWVALLNMALQWSSSLMLGMWSTSADVGLYSVANRTSGLVSFILISVNAISAPKFSEMYSKGDMEGLGRLARSTAKLMALFASPIVLACVLFPGPVMSIFGPEFVAGGPALAILGVGQFVNVVTGSVGYLLIMTGQERVWRNLMGVSAALCLALNALLIPAYGLVGAALAMAASLSVLMLLAVWMVRRSLGIMTVPFVSAGRRGSG
jgi:O-antigen/teichoic acid export membrane protein